MLGFQLSTNNSSEIAITCNLENKELKKCFRNKINELFIIIYTVQHFKKYVTHSSHDYPRQPIWFCFSFSQRRHFLHSLQTLILQTTNIWNHMPPTTITANPITKLTIFLYNTHFTHILNNQIINGNVTAVVTT